MGNLFICSKNCWEEPKIGAEYDPQKYANLPKNHHYAILLEPLAPESIEMLI